MSDPAVTIAIPTYNRSWGLSRAIDSVLAQTYGDFELVIVDDASTDKTETLARSYADSRIRYHRQPQNVGMVANWGACVNLARGRFLVFLADDDRLEPEFLANRVIVLEARPDIFAVFSRYTARDAGGAVTAIALNDWRAARDLRGIDLAAAAFSGWFIGATLYRAATVRRLWPELADDDLVLDLGLNLRLAMTEPGAAAFIPVNDFRMMVHAGQNSQSKIDRVRAQKRDLLRRLLRDPRSAALRETLRRELYDWLTAWGRSERESNGRGAAGRLFLSAVSLSPFRRAAWVQLLRTLSP
jgi:glycosyltransferase involved in cell wall biosynthesis